MNEETALDFPCQFAIKVIGNDNTGKFGPELEKAVQEIVHRYTAISHVGDTYSRLSKDGKYTAVTVMITASSKQHLDSIYKELSVHPLILVAL